MSSIKIINGLIIKIYDSLDFQLTNAQINVLKDIRQDLAQFSPMNRLIQGDVGSGKTIGKFKYTEINKALKKTYDSF